MFKNAFFFTYGALPLHLLLMQMYMVTVSVDGEYI